MSASREAITAELSKHFEKVSSAVDAQEARIKAIDTATQDRVRAQDQRILDLEQKLAGKSAGGNALENSSLVNLGKQIAGDERLPRFLKGEMRNLRIEIPNVAMLRKSVLGNLGTTGVSPAVEYGGFPQQLTGVPQAFARRRLIVLESLSSTPVSTEGVNWPRLDSNSDSAAPQSHEGAQKSETTLTFDREALKMVTVASFLNATTQVLADNPMLGDFINAVMIYDLMKKVEDLIVSGNGNPGSDQISGLLTQGTTYAPPLQHAADMIGQSITNLTALGYTPDLVILSPQEFFSIVSARDLNQRYIGGGWASPRPNNLWGVNVAQSAALGNGTAIVMDTSRATILDREAASIKFGYTGNQFTENQITILSEWRGNLGVYGCEGD